MFSPNLVSEIAFIVSLLRASGCAQPGSLKAGFSCVNSMQQLQRLFTALRLIMLCL